MNDANVLFVISCVFIPLLIISISYESISDFYEYSVPLNKAVIIPNFGPSNDPNEFQKIREEQDSTCYTTPSMNLFCYTKPRIHSNTQSERDHRVSFVIGDTGINGELHFDRVGLEGGIFTIKNITRIYDDTVSITFADKNYRIGNGDRTDYEIIEKFEFTTVVEKYDAFITHCGNFEGTGATIVQYLGVATIDGVDYFLTWHTVITSEQGFSCNYPEIIQHSLKHNFREL